MNIDENKQQAKEPDNHSRSLAVAFKAAVKIQQWYRRYKALLELRRRKIWVIYEKIESSKNAHIKNLMQKIFTNMKLISTANDGPDELACASKTPGLSFYQRIRKFGNAADRDLASSEFGNPGFDDIIIEKAYSGVHLTFPITATQVQNLIESFKAHTMLHEKYLLQLAHEARLVLKCKPNINQVSTSISKQVTVVGSLTGHIGDLMAIFYKNGLPDFTNPYVFNGGFVNMGPHSVQVIAVLCAALLAWPTGVFLNRGAHEDGVMCSQHGFQRELSKLYRNYSHRLSIAFNEMFSLLPLATVVDNKIFITHGGVSDRLDWEAVPDLVRGKFLSPYDMYVNNEANGECDLELDQIIDLLWNIPRQEPGCAKNPKDSIIGSFFGPDVTEKFLKRHGYSMMIRARSYLVDGYDYCHDRKVLTIYSVSGKQSSPGLGSYAKVDDEGQVHIAQFNAKSAYPSIGKQITKAEEDAMRALRSRIAASKAKLTMEFQSLDQTKTGFVTVKEWCKTMDSVMQIDLPWHLLYRHLTVPSKEYCDMVDYMSTFKNVAIKHRKEEAATVTEILYKNKDELEGMFRLIDRKGAGCITLDEFKESCRLVCTIMDQKDFTSEEMDALTQMMDLNNDGKIDYNEFLEAFRIEDLGSAVFMSEAAEKKPAYK